MRKYLSILILGLWLLFPGLAFADAALIGEVGLTVAAGGASPDIFDETFQGSNSCSTDPVGPNNCDIANGWDNWQQGVSNTIDFASATQAYGEEVTSVEIVCGDSANVHYIYHDMGARSGVMYYRLRFYVAEYTGTGTDSVYLLTVNNSAGTASSLSFRVRCYYADASNFFLKVYSPGGDHTTISTSMSKGAWHTIKVKFDTAGDSHGIKLDAGDEVAFSDSGAYANRYFHIGSDASDETESTVYYTDAAASTAAAGIDY